MPHESTALTVIPAFNEELHISDVVSGVRALSLPLDILVVDDGSTDGTVRAARDAGASVISLPFNVGYGGALQTGFKYALRNGYDYLIHLDGDGQHDPESIGLLLEEIKNNGADIVVGSRFLEDPDYRCDTARRIGIAIFRMIAKLTTGRTITDPTSGFQALNRKAFEFYSHEYPSDFPDTDVIITSHRAHFDIKEIPVKIHPSMSGKSMHSGLAPFYYVFKMFLSICVTLLRKRPKKED